MCAASGAPGDNAVERYALFLTSLALSADPTERRTATRARARAGRSPGGDRHGRTHYRALFRQPPAVRQGAITGFGQGSARACGRGS